MKKLKLASAVALLLGAMVTLSGAREDAKKIKPYTLDTCVVCNMKLADVGKPYTFEYKDREIKVCDKGEAADFKKEPAKYLKKIEDAEAKAKAKK